MGRVPPLPQIRAGLRMDEKSGMSMHLVTLATTTDGRAIVYAVFHGDGYECKTLRGIFSTAEKAEAFAGPLRDATLAEYLATMQRIGIDPDECPEFVSVEPLELDSAVRSEVVPCT